MLEDSHSELAGKSATLRPFNSHIWWLIWQECRTVRDTNKEVNSQCHNGCAKPSTWPKHMLQAMGKDYTMDTKNQALLPRSDKLTMPHSFSPRNMTQKVMVQDPRSSQATTPKSRREEAVGHGTTACSTTNDSKHQLCWHRSSSLLPSQVQFCCTSRCSPRSQHVCTIRAPLPRLRHLILSPPPQK